MKNKNLSKEQFEAFSKSGRILLFDTHCHLSDDLYDDKDISRILENQFFKSPWNLLLNVGFDNISNKKVLDQSKFFSSNVYSAIGIHPNSNDDMNEESLKILEEQIINNQVSAIGEIGLCYYRSFTTHDKQKYFFRKQAILAKKYNIPILLHLRDKGDFSAFYDAILIIKEIGCCEGVVHCFSANYEIAEKFVSLGFYISFSGTVTFGNKNLEDVVRKISLNKILVETDSPYLSPRPIRGRKNFPWNVFYNIDFISKLRGISVSDLSLRIFFNSLNMLKIRI